MKWYWFSFSFQGENQGCCNVEANSVEKAWIKIEKLGIVPSYDDIEKYQMKNPELEPNKLISKAEMRKLGY